MPSPDYQSKSIKAGDGKMIVISFNPAEEIVNITVDGRAVRGYSEREGAGIFQNLPYFRETLEDAERRKLAAVPILRFLDSRVSTLSEETLETRKADRLYTRWRLNGRPNGRR